MKLEVGQFARLKRGYIVKVLNVKDNWIETDTKFITRTFPKDFVKASYNIIDLIEVGDYVNGSKVYYCYCADEDSTGLFIDTEKGRQWLDKPSQVKSIVTKEQFESMKYSLEG